MQKLLWDTLAVGEFQHQSAFAMNAGTTKTNLKINGMLSPESAFKATHLMVYGDEKVLRELVAANALMRFDIGQKIMFEVPVWYPSDEVTIAPELLNTLPGKGEPPLLLWGFKPLVIDRRQHFRVSLEHFAKKKFAGEIVVCIVGEAITDVERRKMLEDEQHKDPQHYVDELSYIFFDTAGFTRDAKLCQVFGGANLHDRSKTDLYAPSLIQWSGGYKPQDVLIGGPTDVVRAWQAAGVTYSLDIPPDETKGIALSTLDSETTPLGWTFLKVKNMPPEFAAGAQVFLNLRPGEVTPQGMLKVAIRGELTRDIC